MSTFAQPKNYFSFENDLIYLRTGAIYILNPLHSNISRSMESASKNLIDAHKHTEIQDPNFLGCYYLLYIHTPLTER